MRAFRAAALVLLGGCAGFTTPRAETLAKVAPMPLAKWLPGRFELELASPGLTGTFDAVCAVDGASFRVQLFPDIGGKVLDVTVGPDVVTAELPGSRYVAHAPLDRAEPHVALGLAALFGELLAPVRANRVRGERTGSGGVVEVDLRPALGCGIVTAQLGNEGAIGQYHVALGWIEFTLDADGSFRGRAFRGQLRPAGGG